MRTKRIAMVFQKFALMPWLTVAENVGFGLEMQGRPAAERKKLIDEKLELVGPRSGATSVPTRSPAACSSASAWLARWRWMATSC